MLGVGIATLDIINDVAAWPAEDDEVRALGQRRVRGGNATNTLVVLSQLGHDCSWAGMLPHEPDAAIVLDDLERHRIDLSAVQRPAQGKLPTSYIALSRATGSRTIIHYRDLPEYGLADFEGVNLDGYDWVHFEGRNVPDLDAMLSKSAAQGIPCSLEIEKPRPGVEALFSLPDVLIFSAAYLRSHGGEEPVTFLKRGGFAGKRVFVAWGKAGAWARDPGGGIVFAPAAPVPVVDTLGAGDVFNAAIVHGCVQGWSTERSLQAAVALAGCKCAQVGLDGLDQCDLG